MNSSTLNQVAPDISVAICTYNRSKQLGSTLETVRNQTLPGKSFEIVVIDDGSTDHTERVVSDFGRNSGVPVRYFKQENAGIGQARNRAVAHARAPWVAFIDDDELASESWLSELLKRATQTGADCVGGPCIVRLTGPAPFQPVGTVRMLLGQNPAMMETPSRVSLLERVRNQTTRIPLPGGGNALIRKSLIEKLGGFQCADYAEDLEFFRRAEQHGARFATAPQARAYHLVPPERLLPSRLYALAKRGGTSQATLDASKFNKRRQYKIAMLRMLHACCITAPCLAWYYVRGKRDQIVSRMCSLRFAAAYITSSLHGGAGEKGFHG